MDSSEGFDEETMMMLSANLPSGALNTLLNPDPRLEAARLETERTQQITPILKEELRLFILSKRLEKGEPEIEICTGQPTNYELTEEEKAKRERRKAQNRRAAKKCREKRKMKSLSDAERYRLIMEENQRLRNDVTLLRFKEDIYSRFLREHVTHDSCHLSRNSATSRRLVSLLNHNLDPQPEVAPADRHPSNHQYSPRSICSLPPAPQPDSLHLPGPTFVCQSLPVDVQQVEPTLSSCCQSLPVDVQQVEPTLSSTVEDQLAELPVHELSSFLPTESEFSGSDHSLESSPPILPSPPFFQSMAPHPGDPTCVDSPTSYSHHQPGSSVHLSAQTSTHPGVELPTSSHLQWQLPRYNAQEYPGARYGALSSDQAEHTSHHPVPNTVESDRLTSSGVGPHAVQISQTQRSSPFSLATGSDQSVSGQFETSVLAVDTSFNSKSSFATYSSFNSNSSFSSNNCFTTINNFTTNTALLSDQPLNSLHMLTNLPASQQITPTSPLTSLSSPSPQLPMSPLSPELNFQEQVTGPTGGGGCVCGPARPPVRRLSSTSSSPSSLCGQHLWSPPPSLPSPCSQVAESPSMLAPPPSCQQSAFLPHVTSSSPTRFLEVTEAASIY